MYCKTKNRTINQTKRKIADCVKRLVCQKGIHKITIQDIMNETHMSRQSFYYHFKDIYNVLEWIGIHDFAEHIRYRENETLEAWMLRFIDRVCAERIFCERLVQEIHWAELSAYIRQLVQAEIAQLYDRIDGAYHIYCSREQQYSRNMFALSFCYYLMDYVYHKRDLSREEILQELKSVILMLEEPQAARTGRLVQRNFAAG